MRGSDDGRAWTGSLARKGVGDKDALGDTGLKKAKTTPKGFEPHGAQWVSSPSPLSLGHSEVSRLLKLLQLLKLRKLFKLRKLCSKEGSHTVSPNHLHYASLLP